MNNRTNAMNPTFKIRGNAGSVGVITLRNGKIQLKGFACLLNRRVRIELQNDSVVITPDYTDTDRRCVDFNEATLSRKVLADFFDETESLDCLFVRIGSKWIQCRQITVEKED